MCPKRPATQCIITGPSEDQKQAIITAFDPLKGPGRELARIDVSPKDTPRPFAFDLCPDGTRIAYKTSSEGPIYVVSLGGQPTQEIKLKGWSNLRDLNWTANGKGLLTSNGVLGGAQLLYVDLKGSAHILWQQHGGIASIRLFTMEGLENMIASHPEPTTIQ